MPCRPTIRRWLHSASSSPNSGNDRSGDAVRKTARRGSRSRSWPKIGSRNRIPTPTQGGSRMRESRTYGSVRGALSNERPYRDRFARNDGAGDDAWKHHAPAHPAIHAAPSADLQHRKQIVIDLAGPAHMTDVEPVGLTDTFHQRCL